MQLGGAGDGKMKEVGEEQNHNSSVLSVDPLHLNFGRGKRVKKNSVNISKVPLLLSGLEKLVH